MVQAPSSSLVSSATDGRLRRGASGSCCAESVAPQRSMRAKLKDDGEFLKSRASIKVNLFIDNY